VPWENAAEVGNTIQAQTAEGENIRPMGVESKTDDLLVDKGLRLNPPMVGLLAATGHDQVLVTRKPRIAIFFLGDELLHSGIPVNGSIRDALGPQLPALLETYGAEVIATQFVKDDLAVLNSEISKVLNDVDMIITTGGTADGPKDFVKPAINHLGGRYVIDCAKVRPGYHAIVAKISHKNEEIPFVALPGNPQSALAALTSFGRPIVNSLLGAKNLLPSNVIINEKFKTQDGFSRLIPGNLDSNIFIPTGYLGSAMLRGIAYASGFALVAPGGTSARWLPFSE
jgi:molybdopterin molybdotransferase